MPKPNKTAATTASVDAFIDKQPKEEVRDDCRALMKLMHDITGEHVKSLHTDISTTTGERIIVFSLAGPLAFQCQQPS